MPQRHAETAQAMTRLAAGRIVYTRDQHAGRVYVWTICPICGRLWYTTDAIRRVIKRGGCSRCLP